MLGEWAGPLRELYAYLVRNDEEFELLGDIDQYAPNLDVPLEKTILLAASRLVQLSGAAAAHTYAFDGRNFRLIANSDNDNSALQLTPASLGLDVADERNWAPNVLPRRNYTNELANAFPSSQCIAHLPLFSSHNKCFALALLESREPPESNMLLNNKGIQSYIASVGRQLSNAIILREHAERTQLQSNLTSSFFRKALDPIACFDELAHQVPKFLPQFGPLEIKPEPEVQILLCEPNEDVLRIVGTTGSELRVTRVDVDHSFCGKLLRNPDWRYRVDDPRNDLDYKDYLGREKGKEMQHELAVPIKWNGDIIGVLNLESEHAGAFAETHIRAMQDLCAPEGNPSIAHMVYALKRSILLSDAQQMAMVSALDKHLDHVSRVLRHGTATAASTVGGNLTLLERRIGTDARDLAKYVLDAREEFGKLVNYINTYREDIRGFSKFSCRSIGDIIDRAIAMISPRELERKNIHLTFQPEDNIDIYCSLLLTQHIYDLLNNAEISVEDRLLLNPSVPGRIEITVTREPAPPDWQETKLNKRCRVMIGDNGMGASAEILAKLGQPGVSTRVSKGGTGFGIFGAKRYIETAQGVWLGAESVEGEFFRVMFLLDEYDPDIHKQSNRVPSPTRGKSTEHTR